MSSLFLIIAGVAMLLTLVAIGLGVFSMAKGPAFREQYGNKLMKARVILQAVAIIMLVLAFSAS